MLDRPAELERQARRRQQKRQRDRRHRHRQAQGRIVVPVELGAAELDWLIRLRWVAVDAGDKVEVGAGIGRMIADAARR